MHRMEHSEQTCCEYCKSLFTPKRHYQNPINRQRFCSRTCKSKARFNKRFGEKAYSRGLPSGTVGTISELTISADLLSKKYEVFRALSQNCSCDLAILKNGKLLRIEVRTGYKDMVSGKVFTTKRRVRADILAIVAGGVCYYEPPLPEADGQ
jgi:hypothetical protein